MFLLLISSGCKLFSKLARLMSCRPSMSNFTRTWLGSSATKETSLTSAWPSRTKRTSWEKLNPMTSYLAVLESKSPTKTGGVHSDAIAKITLHFRSKAECSAQYMKTQSNVTFQRLRKSWTAHNCFITNFFHPKPNPQILCTVNTLRPRWRLAWIEGLKQTRWHRLQVAPLSCLCLFSQNVPVCPRVLIALLDT